MNKNILVCKERHKNLIYGIEISTRIKRVLTKEEKSDSFHKEAETYEISSVG